MSSLVLVGRKCRETVARLRREEDGNLPVESIMMVAVAAICLFAMLSVIGVGTNGSVTGGFMGSVESSVGSLIGGLKF